MSSNTSSRTVTFHRPFLLPGMDTPHAPGSFEVRMEQEQLDVMWEAFRRTTTIMLTDGNRQQAWVVTASDLDKALVMDQAEAGLS